MKSDMDPASHEIQAASLRVTTLEALYRHLMRKEIDYGALAGTSKPSLRKEGAELLAMSFQLYPMSIIVSAKEDTDPAHPFFGYVVRCVLHDKLTEKVLGDAIGAANSAELQFAFKWVPASSINEERKVYGERGIGNSKMVRVQLEPYEVFGLQNKVLKMADKRAFVAAILRVTGASRIFTQDLDEEIETATTTASPSSPSPSQDERETEENTVKVVDSVTLDQLKTALSAHLASLDLIEKEDVYELRQRQALLHSEIEEISRIVEGLGGAMEFTKQGRVWEVAKAKQ